MKSLVRRVDRLLGYLGNPEFPNTPDGWRLKADYMERRSRAIQDVRELIEPAMKVRRDRMWRIYDIRWKKRHET